MKIGACIGSDRNKIAVCKKLGYDYVESCFALLTEDDDASFEAFRQELITNEIPCLSVNCFLPGSLKVTGPQADASALKEYVERGMKRGQALGVKKVVFGSAGARNIPEGFPFVEGMRQIFRFITEIVSPIADKYGIIVVIEPLSPKDTNVIRSLREGAEIVAAVNKNNVLLLGDLYHMYNVNDGPTDVRMMKGILRHAHIAEPKKRVYPAPGDECDYKAFLEALEFAGCDTCSVEAGTGDFEKDAANAIAALK